MPLKGGNLTTFIDLSTKFENQIKPPVISKKNRGSSMGAEQFESFLVESLGKTWKEAFLFTACLANRYNNWPQSPLFLGLCKVKKISIQTIRNIASIDESLHARNAHCLLKRLFLDRSE